MTETEKPVNTSAEPVKNVEEESNNDNAAANNEAPTADEVEDESKSVAENGNDSEKPSQLELDIIRQIEYYFGDANLHRDKFLMQKISSDADGWVPFDVLLTFKRLAALTTDVEVIVNALMKSDEGLIEISDDKTKIRRHPERPIPEFNEDTRKELLSRTAYAKGFPLDSQMSDIIDFFKPFEKVLNIYMRKYLDKPTKTYKFKGSVFVTFAKKEQCEEFINKEKVEYKGKELIRKWQDKYFEEKKNERNEIISKKKAKQAKKEQQQVKFKLPKGTVLHFEGCDENTTRENIKEAIANLKISDIAYVEYSKGEKTGYIRLVQENSAKEVLDKLKDKKLKVGEIEITLNTLTEDEEKVFLEKAVNLMKSKRNFNQNKNRNHRKRKTSEKSENEPATKK